MSRIFWPCFAAILIAYGALFELDRWGAATYAIQMRWAEVELAKVEIEKGRLALEGILKLQPNLLLKPAPDKPSIEIVPPPPIPKRDPKLIL